MTEIRARFCNVCGKLVDKEQEVRGELKWQMTYYDTYWQNENNVIVCSNCWRPLWDMLNEVGSPPLTELLAWLVNPHDEENEE